MNVIIPTAIMDSNLIGCTIAENEYDEWEDGGFKELSATGSNRNWTGICCSSSGTLWACAYGGYIYYSLNAGVSWTAHTASGIKYWNGICADGTNIYASVTNSGDIYKLTNETGTFTALGQTARNWSGMGVSAAGNIYACADNQYVYKSLGGADAFTTQIFVGSVVTQICGSPNGDLYATFSPSAVISRDELESGTFLGLSTTVSPARTYRGICARSDGDISVCVNGGDIYERVLGTGNFTAINGTERAWRAMCVDLNDNTYAAVYGGDIYKATGSKNYMIDDYCQVTSVHTTYQSDTNNNRGNDPTTDTTNWTDTGATNRWRVFDDQIWNQSEASESIIWVFAPGTIDALAILNHESSTIDIIEIDNDSNLVLNGLAWTGATGTTEPDDWDKVGTPSDYTIDSGAIKITADGNGEGMSQTMTVTAGDEYQLLFLYKNTSGDVAQVAVYDVTHSADILATTDLASSTDFCPHSYVFTVPAGCTSVRVSLLCKNSGDIVWFDYVKLAPTIYNSTITTGSLITYSVKTDLISEANCILTVKVNNSGSTARCGEIVMGTKYDIGGRAPSFGLSWGIKDWSTIEADTFGNYSIVPREKSKWMKGSIEIASTDFDYVSNLLTAYTTTYLMWIGSETNQCQMIYGFCDDWSFQQDEYSNAVLNFSIAGLT
jgi:hypothetical protein